MTPRHRFTPKAAGKEMVEVSGEAANRNKAATAARAFARPIGGMSEANCREIPENGGPGGSGTINSFQRVAPANRPEPWNRYQNAICCFC